MILEALVRYYERVADDPDVRIAPFGYEPRAIDFLVVLDRDGTVVEFSDLREGEGRKHRGRTFMVPKAPERTSNIVAGDLWDNVGYVFGATSDPDRFEWAKRQHESFKERVRELVHLTQHDPGVVAIEKFLEREDLDGIRKTTNWKAALDGANSVTFRLKDASELICQREAVREALSESRAEPEGVCLVTGESGTVALTHPPIKGVWGAHSRGAKFTSFNLPAFSSHGHDQGFNAPVSERAAFEYSTALNHLLRPDSGQRVQVGDASTIFWSDGESILERTIADLFDDPPKDDPSRGARAMEALFQSPWAGHEPPAEDGRQFFVLGMAPNTSRISIRFWCTDTEGGLARKLLQHFRDLEIDRSKRESGFLSIRRLLASTAPLGKLDNVRPNLAGAVFMSALNGTPYPRELLAAAVQRNRGEQDVPYPRAALIKASLLRLHRRDPRTTPEVHVSLDVANTNTAYRLGRLFAVLERAQETANPGLNATIKDRFYGAASTTPVTVFPRLLKLKNHHLGKLDHRGQEVRFEKMIGEIMDGVEDFPASLSLPDQGQFSIGYYHQRQSFFKPRDDQEIHS